MPKNINTINNITTLSLLTLNVNGLKGKLTSCEFGNSCRMYDVICMNETKCDEFDMLDVTSSMENLGYDVAYKNRHVLSRYKSGGLMIAVKKAIKLNWKVIKK